MEEFLRRLVAGEPAEVSVEGERRPLTAEASQAIRRVAQEALTNTRKHAPGASVVVRLEYRPDAVAWKFGIRVAAGPRASSLSVAPATV